ncbi:MotA/TolQ/ExbB proton channel family protein [Halarcobacter sp.]|uniref:MotA/TolQ/ExbB proton channel family protein n=1 Tax=Halarcobacter sp. TaxID=2321133 RepID=UPI002AA7774C|nr:MotA/TolQ/ExbB proton channel family protein [Halarcobacter sp.]
MPTFSNQKMNNSPRFLVILSLPIFLFIFILLGFLQIIPLKVEIHSLIIIFLILFIFMFFISHNAWYSFALFRNKILENNEELDSYLNQREITFNGKTKSYASLDDYFEKFLLGLRNDNFANVASSIFPTLGILGTFTAIAISMPDFTVDSKQALENEITILLSGVGTAFYASIYGIFLSIWWIFFEKRGLTKIEYEINSIKSSYKDRIWSKDEIELLKLSQGNQNTILEKVQEILTPDYIFKMDELVKKKLEYLDDINRAFLSIENKISTNYINLSSMFEKSSQKQENILESFEEIEKSIKKISYEYEKSLEKQNLNDKAVKAEIYSVLSSFQLVSNDLKELGKDLINAK